MSKIDYSKLKNIGVDECVSVNNSLEILNFLGITDNLYTICQNLNYPFYVTNCMAQHSKTGKFISDKELYEIKYDSWKYLYDILYKDDFSKKDRRYSYVKNDVRTLSCTCRDLSANDIVESYLVKLLAEKIPDNFASNDDRDNNGHFQITRNATVYPDFTIQVNGKEYLLELKCLNRPSIGFNFRNNTFIIDDLYHKHDRYVEYKDNIFFLMVDIKHQKATIFSYDDIKGKVTPLDSIKNLYIADFESETFFDNILNLILEKFK